MPRVCASIVLYKQDDDTVYQLLKALRPQVDTILVYDNNEPPLTSTLSLPDNNNMHYFRLGKNTGTAIPHNLAYQWARDRRFSHIITFDQDSNISPNLVSKLVAAESKLLSDGKNVACVGPTFLDPRTSSPAPFVRLRSWKIEKTTCERGKTDDYLEAEYLITSGTLTRIEIFNEVGPFDESFFIDYIDIEWGLRARAKGFEVFGVCNATMDHPIGDVPLVLPILNKTVPLHSPVRHYYHFRNAILLYRRDYASSAWVFNDAIRLLAKYIVYSLFTHEKLIHIKMMTKGFWHGLTGKAGRLS